MLQGFTSSGIIIFDVIIGLVLILLAFSIQRSPRAFRQKSMSEGFDLPAFQSLANMWKWLARLYMVMFGLGFLVDGAGARLFSAEVAEATSSFLFVAAFLIFMVSIIVLIIIRHK